MTKKEPKIKIFVAHHKPGYIYEDDIYVPIQVGKKNAKIDLGILGDDTGDNISDRNSQYAELTAQYWVWKNYDLSDVDYVGFCHYRRYMTYCYKPNFFYHLIAKNYNDKNYDSSLLTRRIRSLREFNHICKFNKNTLRNNSQNIKTFIQNNSCDVYTPKRVLLIGKFLKYFGIDYKSSASFGLTNNTNLRNDASLLFVKKYTYGQDIIKGVEEECKSYYMLNRHIYIMKRDYFLMYMNWLFDFLFDFEKLLNKGEYGYFHERFIAVFSEPLITYWLYFMEHYKDIIVSSESNKILFIE